MTRDTKRRMESMDGNAAAAYVSYAFTEVAAIYPITPSSDMAQLVDEWAAEGRTNLFGQTVDVVEMQSEGGAAGAVHGSLQAGALTSTYTSAQGLMLMIPNMFKIAGELLPGVFHVSSRLVASNGLGIFCDHSDVMAVRSTGFAILSCGSVQQVMDLATVAHLSAIKGRVPFVSFFDGFRTSHEIQKIERIDYAAMASLIDRDAVNAFRRKALNPDHPVIRGTVQNADIHFQQREVINRYWEELPDVVDGYMDAVRELTGREYHPFTYYGAPDAEHMIVAMGSLCQTVEEVVDYVNAQGRKVGLLAVHLFRPFSLKHFFKYIPATVRRIAVIDRVKEIGAQGEPLYLDVKSAFYGRAQQPLIVGGRLGIGGKDIQPRHIAAVFANLEAPDPRDHFTVGIVDDLNGTSLDVGEELDTSAPGTKACKFWGLGSDGTVGANKSVIKIIGDSTDQYTQAYFAYDSKKSGGVTVSHLRFGRQPIRSTYLIQHADFVSCSQQSYLDKYDVLQGLKPGGTFLLNTIWSPEELERNLPAKMKRALAENDINFYTINAVKLAGELGLGGRINMIMQAAFLKLAEIIPLEQAVAELKKSVRKSYGKKGDDIVAMNNAAIDRGLEALVRIEVPEAWNTAEDPGQDPAGDMARAGRRRSLERYVNDFLLPVNRLEGDAIPVSGLIPMEDGTYPAGTAAFEKRGIAVKVPQWIPEHCLQCNQCSFVCPHAAIRPVLATEAEVNGAPAGFATLTALGGKDSRYRIAVSPLDCTGCMNCVNTCPARKKALEMRPIASQMLQAALWDYAMSLPEKNTILDPLTVKGSQFAKPLLEFSGACAGCMETAYAKLLTQMFGDRMMIANSAGCTHVWAASVPANPYTVNSRGHGPAWISSLFEDTAELGLGLLLGTRQVRRQVAGWVEQLARRDLDPAVTAACREWLEHREESAGTRERADKLVAALEPLRHSQPLAGDIHENRDYLVKRSQWLIGGDGWAYDIGYGGLDHALASGENLNVLVLDTEVYSNTGGQSSKATPTAAVAKFAAGGKRTRKKDLGRMFMSYGYVYVAQISMGADKAQTVKALAEAEAYPGPSLVIAYSTCIAHGVRSGMGTFQDEAKRAVDSGYWALYRYNPTRAQEGRNPFRLDSKAPSLKFRDFLMGEVRYASLLKASPDTAEALFAKTERDAMERLETYRKMAEAGV